jgi:hypothetical protein
MKEKTTIEATPESIRWERIEKGFDSVRKLHKEIAQQQKKFAAEAAARFKEAEVRFREAEVRFKKNEEAALRSSQEAEARSKKLDAKLDRLNEIVGGTANNNGFFAEEHFFNALESSHCFGNIQYDFVLRNENRREGKLENEYDILMLNGSSVAIIETKYRAHQNYLETLVTKKVQDFRALHPNYAKHKIYLGIASMSFNKEVIAQAKKLGIGILKQVGNVVECDTEHIKAY